MEGEINMRKKALQKTFNAKYLYMNGEILIFARELNIWKPRIEHFDDEN